MGYKTTMGFGMVGLNTDPDTMIEQNPSRIKQGFLNRQRVLSLAFHLCLFLIYAGGFMYAAQDLVRHRHEAGLIHCTLPVEKLLREL